MKKYTRAICLALIAALVCAAGFALAEGDTETVNDQLFVTPEIVAFEGCYREADLTETDILQGQVAAYESDSVENPDIDVYVFENKGRLQDYVQSEAAVFGTQALPIIINGEDGWVYVSSELFDGEWYIVRNFIYQLDDTMNEEECAYAKTQPITIDGSYLNVHIPVRYKPIEKAAEDYVTRSYATVSSEWYKVVSDPSAIDVIYSENVTPEELVEKIVKDTGLDFEIVTINGKNLFVLYGEQTDGEDNTLFVKTYLYESEKGTSGMRFTFIDDSNGADLAIMRTLGF